MDWEEFYIGIDLFTLNYADTKVNNQQLDLRIELNARQFGLLNIHQCFLCVNYFYFWYLPAQEQIVEKVVDLSENSFAGKSSHAMSLASDG